MEAWEGEERWAEEKWRLGREKGVGLRRSGGLGGRREVG